MVTMEQLSKLAKEVMACSVDAQLLGLREASDYLGMAFEEMVRVASDLKTEAGTADMEEFVGMGGDVAGGS